MAGGGGRAKKEALRGEALLVVAAAPAKYRRGTVSQSIPLPPSRKYAHRLGADRPITEELLRQGRIARPIERPDPHPRGGQASLGHS